MAVYVVVGVAPFFLTNFLPIAASRIAVGLTEGVVLTVTTALLGDYFKGRARDRLMGFQAAIATISASLLIPLSGYLGASIGWNGPFLIYGLALLWFLGILLLTWEPAPDLAAGERKGRASWQGFPAARMLEICAVTVVGGYFFYTAQFEVPNVLPQFGVTDPARIGALMGFVSWGMVTGSLGYQFVVGRPRGLRNEQRPAALGGFDLLQRVLQFKVLGGREFGRLKQVAQGADALALLGFLRHGEGDSGAVDAHVRRQRVGPAEVVGRG